jgi:GWxTD domain-containing protein
MIIQNWINNVYIGGFALLLLAISGCKSTSPVSSSDLSEIYQRSDEFLEPDFKVYHFSHDSTAIFFRFNSKNLLFIPTPGKTELQAKVKISYELFQDYESNKLIDSASTIIEIVGDGETEQLVSGKFHLALKRGKNYLVRLYGIDLNRNQSTNGVFALSKSDSTGRNEFLVREKNTGRAIFRDFISKDDHLTVTYAGTKPTAVIYGKYYDRTFPVAPPPFAAFTPKPFNYEPDSTFVIPLDDSNTFDFHSDETGFYHFTVNEDDRNGLSLFHFKDGYPTINSVDELISATRFITSKKEYHKIADASDPKAALDAFWLSTTKDPERARELIKTYFNRVQNANLYFSSYKEGWKTDRGIIYMVFGPPNTVYQSEKSESWIYGEEDNYLSVTFNFSKVNNPFTNNDFILQRSPSYKTQWYRAVDAWRQGRVSTLDY